MDEGEDIVLIGAPSSAGSHNEGQEVTPRLLREAGLVQALCSSGLRVRDAGDTPIFRWEPWQRRTRIRQRPDVAEHIEAVRTAVRAARAEGGRVVLVVGGDCSTTLGVVAGVQATRPVAVAYLDGDVDLNTPEISRSGVADTMAAALMLNVDGCQQELGLRSPVAVASGRVAFLGFDPSDVEEYEAQVMAGLGSWAADAGTVQQDPAGAARTSLGRVAGDDVDLVVHFDVDSVTFADLPLANWPHHNGLTRDAATACLAELAASGSLAAICVTEVDLTTEEGDKAVADLVQLLADALRSRRGRRGK